jgi:hypothetical protein
MAHRGQKINGFKILTIKPGGDNLGYPGVDARKILKWSLKKFNVKF